MHSRKRVKCPVFRFPVEPTDWRRSLHRDRDTCEVVACPQNIRLVIESDPIAAWLAERADLARLGRRLRRYGIDASWDLIAETLADPWPDFANIQDWRWLLSRDRDSRKVTACLENILLIIRHDRIAAQADPSRLRKRLLLYGIDADPEMIARAPDGSWPDWR